MGTKQPADAIPDDLILAAIDRAERHTQRQGVPIWQIQEHLSVPRRSGQGRQVRARVLALADLGLLQARRRHGADVWTLTAAARRRLRRAPGIAEALPESPQHQAWRQATTLAAQEIERMRESLRATLAEAVEQLDADAPSDAWFELSERLQSDARLVGSATHCLREWPEPSDDHADIDDHTDPSDAGLSEEQRRHRTTRRAGRRNVRLWGSERQG